MFNKKIFSKSVLLKVTTGIITTLVLIVAFSFLPKKMSKIISFNGEILAIAIDTRDQNINEINPNKWRFKIIVKDTTNTTVTLYYPYHPTTEKTNLLNWLREELRVNGQNAYQLHKINILEQIINGQPVREINSLNKENIITQKSGGGNKP